MKKPKYRQNQDQTAYFLSRFRLANFEILCPTGC